MKQLSVLLENQDEMASTYTAWQDAAPSAICVDGEYYLGELRIKSLGLELPVMDDWDYTRLKKAPCRYYGSVYHGNLVIAAHNYRCHFGSLQQLTQGDVVEFIDARGVTHQFHVTDTAIRKPQEVDRLVRDEDETWELSLFTCTQSGQARYVVRCHSL